MANRRMFAKTIVESDDFIDMGATARLLYYDLGIQADDDGFVQPKRIMRMTGASADDLKVLIGKGFIIPMDEKVLVIRDWLINNEIRQDRYKETIFQDHKKQLNYTKSRQYMLGSTSGSTSGSYSIVEDRIEKDSINNNNSFKKEKNDDLLLKEIKDWVEVDFKSEINSRHKMERGMWVVMGKDHKKYFWHNKKFYEYEKQSSKVDNYKMYYKGCPVIKDYGKLYVLQQGNKLLFTGNEKDIEYK